MIRLSSKSVIIFAIYGFVTRIYEAYHVARHAYNTHLPCCQNQTAPSICIVFKISTLGGFSFGWVSKNVYKMYFYSSSLTIF